MEPPPARNFQSCTTNHWLDLWGGKSRKWGWFILCSPWRGWRVFMSCCWCFPSSSPFLQSLLQSIPSLALRVLACSWVSRESESCKWEDQWESVTSAEKYLSHFMLTCGSYFHKWQTTHFPLLLLIWYLSDTPVDQADCPITCCLCWIDSTIKWVSIGDRVIVSWCNLWGWVGVDDVNRISLVSFEVPSLAWRVSLTMVIREWLLFISGRFTAIIYV